ncbi:hypothetical protein LQW54_011185 [Pestalotiopsis sp. IQ-011]
MPPRASLSAFLASAKSALAASTTTTTKQKLTFVVGNESAGEYTCYAVPEFSSVIRNTNRPLQDLDSLCSALLLAYLRTYTPPHTLHIPLCHLARDDLSLRPEFAEVLRQTAASPDDVLTLDDLPAVVDDDDARWLLVDHNCLTGRLARFNGDSVVGCVDHHADEGRVPRGAEPRVLEHSGSCASLVVDYGRAAWDELRSSSADREVDAQLAKLALAPIVIDTTNLEAETKTTAFDVEAVRYLEGEVLKGVSSFDRTAYFSALARLKGDISPLSLRDVLRKDYKEWDEGGLKLGTSSAPASMADLRRKAGGVAELVDAAEAWGDERGLDLAAVMTAFKPAGGDFGRELMLLARSPKGVEAAGRFEKEHEGKLELRGWERGELDCVEEGAWRKCWSQGRVENSRKQVAPMLRQAMDS